MKDSFEDDPTPRVSWYGIAVAIGAGLLVIAAVLSVALLIYYAL